MVFDCVFRSGLSLRAGGRGFSPATKRVAPGYFYWKIEPKEIPSHLIPRLLVVFTRQLEILVTTLLDGNYCSCHSFLAWRRRGNDRGSFAEGLFS